MRKSFLAVTCAILGALSACSSDSADSGTDSSADLAAPSVDELLTALEDNGWSCIDSETPVSLRTCMADDSSSHVLYVFYGDDGDPERVFVSYAYPKVVDLAIDTLLSAVPADDVKDAQFDENVVQFGDSAVRGGDDLLIASTVDMAKEPFPDMPQIDTDAVVSGLEQAYGIECEGASTEYECNAAGVAVEVGPDTSIVDDSPPVVVNAEIDQEFSSDDKFVGVPEFFEAVGMPLTAQAQDLIADCQDQGAACSATYVNDSGLLVQIDSGTSSTSIDIAPMTPVA